MHDDGNGRRDTSERVEVEVGITGVSLARSHKPCTWFVTLPGTFISVIFLLAATILHGICHHANTTLGNLPASRGLLNGIEMARRLDCRIFPTLRCAGGDTRAARAHDMVRRAFCTMDPAVDRIFVVPQGLIREEAKLSWSKDFI